MNNQVYKCERCGKLYTEADMRKIHDQRRYYLANSDHNSLRDDGCVGLCDECSIALNDFMDREKTRTAPTPEKKEETPNFDEFIYKVLAAQELIEHAMRTNKEKS